MLLGKGDGTFATAVTFPTGGSPSSLVLSQITSAAGAIGLRLQQRLNVGVLKHRIGDGARGRIPTRPSGPIPSIHLLPRVRSGLKRRGMGG